MNPSIGGSSALAEEIILIFLAVGWILVISFLIYMLISGKIPNLKY